MISVRFSPFRRLAPLYRYIGTLFLVPSLLLTLSACQSQIQNQNSVQTQTLPLLPPMEFSHSTVTLTGPAGSALTLAVEIAATPEQLERGLMERQTLPPDAGMLFVFPAPQPLTFWMKNTLIPLDVLFFAADGSLVSSTTMQPCITDPCATYSSNGTAGYALEVNASYAKEHGVGEGWVLKMPRNQDPKTM